MEVGLSDLHSNAELTHEVVEILYDCYENNSAAVLELRQNSGLWTHRQLELLSRPPSYLVQGSPPPYPCPLVFCLSQDHPLCKIENSSSFQADVCLLLPSLPWSLALLSDSMWIWSLSHVTGLQEFMGVRFTIFFIQISARLKFFIIKKLQGMCGNKPQVSLWNWRRLSIVIRKNYIDLLEKNVTTKYPVNQTSVRVRKWQKSQPTPTLGDDW